MQTNIETSPSRSIRKEFFAFRNGIVADKLRQAGDPHTIIMGCLLADITAIVERTRTSIGQDDQLAHLANELWADLNSRECRLAAPMLFPPEFMSQELALQWCESVETVEIADNLCHKLLRKTPIAEDLLQSLTSHERPLTRYTGYRLMLNLLLMGKVKPSSQLRALIGSEADEQLFGQLLKAIDEEWEY